MFIRSSVATKGQGGRWWTEGGNSTVLRKYDILHARGKRVRIYTSELHECVAASKKPQPLRGVKTRKTCRRTTSASCLLGWIIFIYLYGVLAVHRIYTQNAETSTMAYHDGSVSKTPTGTRHSQTQTDTDSSDAAWVKVKARKLNKYHTLHRWPTVAWLTPTAVRCGARWVGCSHL